MFLFVICRSSYDIWKWTLKCITGVKVTRVALPWWDWWPSERGHFHSGTARTDLIDSTPSQQEWRSTAFLGREDRVGTELIRQHAQAGQTALSRNRYPDLDVTFLNLSTTVGLFKLAGTGPSVKAAQVQT